MSGHTARDRQTGFQITDYLMLLLGASYWPLGVMARNLAGVVHPERLLGLALGVWALSLGAVWILRALGLPTRSAVNSVFVAIVVLMSGGRILRELGDVLGWTAIFLIIAGAAVLLHRLRGTVVASAVLTATWVALLSGIGIALSLSWLEWSPETVQEPVTNVIEMGRHPDIFLVVLDGYPGLRTFEQDFGEIDRAFLSQLRQQGFQVPSSAWSSYWTTSLSISSLLDMSLPVVEPGGGVNEARLQEIIAGESSLVSFLIGEGYRTHMLESGWTLSGCGAAMDICIESDFLDEAMFLTLADTVAGPYVFQRFGYPFTLGSVRTMSWLLDNAGELSANTSPDFVFAHVLAPHPPFFLDASCETSVEYPRSGVNLLLSGISIEEREQYFLDQVSCVNAFLLGLSTLVRQDDVVIFVGDHGTDRRGQQQVPGAEWDTRAVVERMNVFVAVRTGTPCQIDDRVMIPDIMRQVFSCLGSIEPDQTQPRMFLNGVVELEEATVAAIVDEG